MKLRRKIISIILAGAMGIGSLATCGMTVAAEEEVTKIAVIVPGVRGDLGFTDSMYSGYEAIQEEFGDKVEITFTECNRDTSKFESTIYDTCDSEPDLIITPAGSGFADYISAAAVEYPDIEFYIVDINAAYENITTDNVAALSYKQNEVTFLTGALGALLTESDTIGYVAGLSNAVIDDFTVGYIQGAQYINPDIKIIISYIGDFLDTAKAKELASQQIGLGADVVAQVAGTAGLGVLDAAKDADIWGIGVDGDQGAAYAESDPVMADHIATSAMKNGGKAILDFTERYLSGADDIPWGGIESKGLAEGVVEIAKGELWEKNIPEDIRTQIEDLEGKIISGEIEVVSAFDITTEEFQSYVDSCQ